ncbi:hypothetical protein ACTXT7_003373 [Hymenolepis weldensis]
MTCDLTPPPPLPPPEKDMGKWRDCRLIATRSIESCDQSCMFKPPLFTSFFLPVGAMTDMPAVRVFALYAGVAIVINFLLQIFAFTALLTLDAKRMEERILGRRVASSLPGKKDEFCRPSPSLISQL